MSNRLTEFPASTTVVLVTFTETELLQQYSANRSVGYPLLRDPDRAAYRAFGLDRASIARVWGLRSARRYLEIFRTEGFRRPQLEKPANRAAPEDTRQLGGNFVIDPAGRLHWGFWAAGPDERPTVDELIAAATAAGSSEPAVSQ